MKRLKRFLVPVVLGVLLLPLLVGPTGGAPLGAVVKTLAVSAADCYPCEDDVDYENYGIYLKGTHGTGQVHFICPVKFPEYGKHRVRAITMCVYDQHTWKDYDVFAFALRHNLLQGTATTMGTVRSTGSSATKPRCFTIKGAKINPKVLYPKNGMYFRVIMEGHNNLWLFGFRVKYTVS